jgi:hypothetical protein
VTEEESVAEEEEEGVIEEEGVVGEASIVYGCITGRGLSLLFLRRTDVGVDFLPARCNFALLLTICADFGLAR